MRWMLLLQAATRQPAIRLEATWIFPCCPPRGRHSRLWPAGMLHNGRKDEVSWKCIGGTAGCRAEVDNERGSGTVCSGIDRASRDESYVVRSQAAQTAAVLGADSALPILKRMLNDTTARFEWRRWNRWAHFYQKQKTCCFPILDGPDSAARAIVLEALAKQRTANTCRVLSRLLKQTRIWTLAAQSWMRLRIMRFPRHWCNANSASICNYTLRKRAVDALKKMNGPILFEMEKQSMRIAFLRDPEK